MPMSIGILADSHAEGSAWSPLDLTGLFAWWDPSNTASITSSSGAVSQLNDLSGNSRHVAQATEDKKPTTGTRTINGLNVLDYSPFEQLRVSGQTLSVPFTVAMIVESDVVDLNYYDFFDGGGGVASLGLWNGHWFYGTSLSFVETDDAYDADPHLVVAKFNGASSSLRIDGIEIDARSLSGGNISGAIDLGRSHDGAISESLITNVATSGTDLTDMESYMMNKWGI